MTRARPTWLHRGAALPGAQERIDGDTAVAVAAAQPDPRRAALLLAPDAQSVRMQIQQMGDLNGRQKGFGHRLLAGASEPPTPYLTYYFTEQRGFSVLNSSVALSMPSPFVARSLECFSGMLVACRGTTLSTTLSSMSS
jgi:hypothetical protein